MIRFLLIFVILNFVSSPIFAHSQSQIIEMTANGFEPDPVSVDINSTLIFVNKDTDPRWPASNVHPTHEIYSEFDPEKPIEPGESWVFKPKRAGSFKYHDHLKPHMRGNLIVKEEIEDEEEISNKEITPVSKGEKAPFMKSIQDFITNFLNNLKGFFASKQVNKFNQPTKDDFLKLKNEDQQATLQKLVDNQKAQSGWEYIKTIFKGQSGSSGNIHDLAHLSGKLIYDKAGFDGIASCSSEFSFGCYHGFLDAAFSKNLDHLQDAQSACFKLGTNNQSISGPVASCIHGIGHGVASFYSVKDLKASLASCRKLSESAREYCFDGVFMEFVRSAPDNFFKADNPLYPCNSLEKEYGATYSFSCGRNQPSLLMGRFKKSIEEVAQICASADSKPFTKACVDALGFSLASSADVSQIIAGCQALQDPKYILECTKSAAGEMVFQEAPNWDEKSKQVCNSLEEIDECMGDVNRIVSEYKRVRKINFIKPQDNEDPSMYIRAQIKICYESNGRDGCYKQVAKLLYDQFGLSKMLKLLKDNENFPEVYARCHEVTHYLSRLEYDKQKSIAKVYAQCDSTCHGGCYHGTMEAYLKDQESQKNFELEVKFASVCGHPDDYQTPLEFNECLHGMGHAAMFVTDMELLQSLKLCDAIVKVGQRERCYTGVFMENSSSSTSVDHASKYIKADDPFYPCNSLEEKYQPLCWQYQSSYFALANGQDWVKVAQMCLQVPVSYQDRCFRTIGTNQVGFTSDLSVMKDDCDLMPTDHFGDVCVGGVISSLAYRFVGDVSKMNDFCNLVNSQYKETCFKQVGTSFLDWTSDKNKALEKCRQISDPQGVSWCLSAV